MKHIILLFLFLPFGFLFSGSDLVSPREKSMLKVEPVADKLTKRKARALHRKAKRDFQLGRSSKAIERYLKLIEYKPDNPVYLYELGVVYYYAPYIKPQGLPYLQRAAANQQKDSVQDVYFFLGDLEHLSGNYTAARDYFSLYLKFVSANRSVLSTPEERELIKEVKQRIAWCNSALEIMAYRPSGFPFYTGTEPFEIVKPGTAINGPEDDYSTVLSPGDSVLYFASRRPGEKKGKIETEDDKFLEKIYTSKRSADGWKTASPIPSLNSKKYHEAPNGIFPDGKKMYIYKGLKRGAIYVSEYSGGQWNKPVPVKGQDINKKSRETSTSVSRIDDNRLFVVSDREGGYGGRDIYTTTVASDGAWGPLENLGPEINTPYDEESPFLTPDGNTLYFSSNGPGSVGGFDIFVSEKKDGKWSKPRNLGFPVNSTGDEVYFHFSSKGDFALFSSNRTENGRNDFNIYTIQPGCLNLPDVPLVIVTENINRKIKVTLKEKNSGTEVIPGETVSGRRTFTLKTGSEYLETLEIDGIVKTQTLSIPPSCNERPFVQVIRGNAETVSAAGNQLEASIENYFFNPPPGFSPADPYAAHQQQMKNNPGQSGYSQTKLNFTFPGIVVAKNEDKDKDKNINIDKKVMQLFFGFDKWNLSPEMKADISSWAQTIKNSGYQGKIIVEGYSDNKGTRDYNKILGERRARQVARELKKHGITSVQIVSYGESKPLGDNKTAEGRKLNRRVDIRME